MISYLECIMKLINGTENRKEKDKQLKKEIIERGQFSISYKHNSKIKFILYMDINGSVIFYREEKILMDNKIYNKINMQHLNKDVERLNETGDLWSVTLKWKIGDLLFNRNEISST